MHLVHRRTCRVCGSSSLVEAINLGEQYLQGSFVKPGKELPPTRKIPTSVVRCDPTQDEKACGLLQMAHSVPSNILYSAYWYRSGTNKTMRDHLKGIVDNALQLVNKENAIVLDIGCNDGTLLNYYPKSFSKFGIDPSDVAQEIKGDINIIQDIFPSRELNLKCKDIQFDIITSIAMFYDLENPISFAKEIQRLLSPNGLWIFEMSYMPQMLRMNSYDTICHEHLEYYSLSVLEYILKMAEMKLVKVDLNEINGGSIRCYAADKLSSAFQNHESIELIEKLRFEEFGMELDSSKPYRNFQERINVHREELHTLLKKLKSEGKKIHIYGASTKGNTILQWCNLDNSIIDYAADRNPDKYGAKTLGTNIPIISEANSREMNPDYYLVLPWHFKSEFLEREKELLNRGTAMIFPLPTIEIIKK